MFLNDVVMGHEFRPKFWNAESLNKAHKGKGRISGKPFHSINVQGGTCGVLNNEIIVWDTDQINIKYLCEFAS
jgi:poly [ADP-ribose] polymerase